MKLAGDSTPRCGGKTQRAS